MQIFTQPSSGQAESRLSENLHCKSPPFLTKWWDLLDLSQERNLLGMVYICPIGSREGMNNFFFQKSVFLKHPSDAGVTKKHQKFIFEYWVVSQKSYLNMGDLKKSVFAYLKFNICIPKSLYLHTKYSFLLQFTFNLYSVRSSAKCMT